MTDFETFDDDLAIALQRRVPQIETAGIGTASAHDAVLARAHGIRRRRAGIAGGATLAAVIAGGFLLLNGDADDTLAPATVPSTAIAPDTVAPTSTSQVETSTVPRPSTTVDSVATVITVPVPPVTATASTDAETETVPPMTAQATASSSSTSSTVATQAPASSTETHDSSGGSITVTWNGSALTLDAVNPTEGHTAEIEDNTPTRIRVRFHGPAESRIEVRIENGQVTERID